MSDLRTEQADTEAQQFNDDLSDDRGGLAVISMGMSAMFCLAVGLFCRGDWPSSVAAILIAVLCSVAGGVIGWLLRGDR